MTDERIHKRIRRSLWVSFPLLTLSVLFLAVSFICDFKYQGDDPAYWFQRGGSIAVLLAAISEYMLLCVDSEINYPESGYVGEDKWKKKYGTLHKSANIFALMVAVIGTIVWGYGDIPFKYS